MAYSSDKKKQQFEGDAKQLVKAITNFQEDEENFTTCKDFVLSNLLYHSFLDVNSHEVNRSISGFYEKFFVNSDLIRARSFKAASDKLVDIFNKRHGSEKEAGYSILAVLLHLSGSSSSYLPASESFSPESENLENEENSIDWTSYLHEGEDRYILSDTSSEVFSSDEGSVEEDIDIVPEEIETISLPVPPRDDSGLGISPDSCSGGSQQLFQINNNYNNNPVQDDLLKSTSNTVQNKNVYLYWQLENQESFFLCKYQLITRNFTKMYEDHIAAQSSVPSIVNKVMLHERNVLKETLWMLEGVKDLFVFKWSGYFIVNPVVHLCNLTSESLGLILKDFCEYGTKGVFLRDFIEEVLLEDTTGPNFCRTFQTYVAALQKQLQKINDSLVALEKTLMMRKETFTILILMKECKAIFNDLDVLFYLNHDILDALPVNCDPFEKSCRLLRVLWRRLLHFSLRDRSTSSLKIILTLFLETCKPFFTFLESLTIHGDFSDTREEFICRRKADIDVTDPEEYWEFGLTMKVLPSDIQDDFFLESFFQEIGVAGKSTEIFNRMNFLMKVPPLRLHVEKGELYSKFIYILHKLLNKKTPLKPPADCSTRILNENKLVVDDPILTQKVFDYDQFTGKFFRPSKNPVYMPVYVNPPKKLFTDMQIGTEMAIEALETKYWRPLTFSVIRAFQTCMEYAYHPTCRRLMKSLKEEYNLMTHMNIMQKYFLMESGDLMFSFYSKVFEKIFYNEPWQNVYFLYNVLQNAISEDEENSKNLSIFLDTSNSNIQISQPLSHLNALQLSYEVKWPVSIMLGNSIQNQYRLFFSFLLQIKAAKYLLDELYFIRLYETGKGPQSKLSKLVSRSVFPKQQKIHGMYIIRMRLLYFVNGLHNYLMARILYSFGSEFNVILENAQTVDDIIVAHNSYLKSLHERCFLDRRLSHLREQIFQVLNLCYSFQQLWLKGVDAISLEELEDIEFQFSKHSNFLYSYFNTALVRGVYPHLENLVSSMLSETHNLYVFKSKKGITQTAL